jgi:fibronectin-binding autotransporter adhesin
VRIKAQEQMLGRLGLAIDYRVGDGSSKPMRKVYGIANLLHRFSDDPESFYSGQRYSAEVEQTWGELGIGGSIDWYNDEEDSLFKLYGEIAGRWAGGRSESTGVHITLGARRAW